MQPKPRQSYIAIHNEHFPVFITEQNLVGIAAVILVVFNRRLRIHMMRHYVNDIIHKTGSTHTRKDRPIPHTDKVTDAITDL